MRAIFSRFLNAPALARWRQSYAEWRLSQSKPDVPKCDENGIPFPNAYLMTRVAGNIDWQGFQESGKRELTLFRDLIAEQGGDLASAERILDFGCGCGRLTRHLPSMSQANIYGCDYNRRLVNWCAENLTGAFQTNRLKPPLGYADESFDIIYLYSVFTHLREATQKAWLEEFHRVLKPGGLVLISFHDEDHRALREIGIAADAFERQPFLVHNDQAEGSNHLSAYQTREHFVSQAAEWFEVLTVKSSIESEVGQAVAVLRR